MSVPSDIKNSDRAPETDEDQLAADIAAEFAEVANDAPEPSSPETAWCQVWDPISSSYYYYNYVTQVSQFEIPAELQVARENNVESEDHESQREGGRAAVIGLLASSLKSYPPELRAVLRIQGTFRSKQARRAVRKVRAQQHVEKKDVSVSAVSHWHKLQDPASGADYYYHGVTQEVSWTLPDGERLAGEDEDLYTTDSRDLGSAASQETGQESVQEMVAEEWIELFDPATGRNYYFNSKTQASQWEKPASFQKFSLEDIGQKLMPPEVRAAVLVQNTWRAKVARREMRKQRGLKLGVASPKEGNDIGSSPWQVLTDPQSGFDYFYNTETQEVTWEAPQDIAKALSSTSWTWVELIDPASSKPYFYNQKTGVSTWSRPEEEEESSTDIGTASKGLDHRLQEDLRAVIRIQIAFRAKIARRRVRQLRAIRFQGASDRLWVEILDNVTGHPYFFNTRTLEVSWDPPSRNGSMLASSRKPSSAEKSNSLAELSAKAVSVAESESSVARDSDEPKDATSSKDSLSNEKEINPIVSISGAGVQETETAARAAGANLINVPPSAPETSDSNDESKELSNRIAQGTKSAIENEFQTSESAPGAVKSNSESRSSPNVLFVENDAADPSSSSSEASKPEVADKPLLAPKNASTDESGAEAPKEETHGTTSAPTVASPSTTTKAIGSQQECINATVETSRESIADAGRDSSPEPKIEADSDVEEEEEEAEDASSDDDSSLGDQNTKRDSSTTTKSASQRLSTSECGKDLEKGDAKLLGDDGGTEAESEMEEDTEGEARAAGLSEEAAQRLRMAEVSSVINKQRFNILQKLSEAAVGAGTVLEDRKLKSIKQSVRVAELAAEEAETLLDKVAFARTTSAKEEELPEAVKAVIFCEAQQMLATKAIFALHCALLDKSLAKLVEIGRLIKDNELATSRTLATQENRVAEAVELAQLRTKHVQIFSHRNSVSEALLQERWTKVRRSGRSSLVVYTTRYYSRRISKLEAEEYEEAFAKTLAAARENAEGFDSELGFIVDKIEGSSPWWPTYKAAMSATLDVWTQVCELFLFAQESLQAAREERELRRMMAEEANQRAAAATRGSVNYEMACRRAFVKTCRKAWAKGLRQRKRQEERTSESDARVELGTGPGGASKTSPSKAKRKKKSQTTLIVRKDGFRSPWHACTASKSTLEDFTEALEEERRRRMCQEQRSFSLDQPDPDSGRLLLHVACWYSRADIVNFLLVQGANPNAAQSGLDLTRPIHVAARAGRSDIIESLVSHGASLYAQDSAGDTALHWACRVESLPCVRTLLALSRSQAGHADPKAGLWALVSRMNERARLPTELLPRAEDGVSYTGKRILKLLRQLEIEGQSKLLEADA